MSTTVTYKGSPLLNIDNDIKTLYTQGKYLEGDITLSDVSEHLNMQTDKSVSYTPTTTQQTDTVYPDIGYDAMTAVAVTVGAVATGSATTPSTTITANPSISVSSGGLITATASASQNVTPTVSAGYVSSGTAGTITVSGSNTSQLTTQAAQTITPTTTNQTIASGKYLTGAQTILGDANLLAENIAKDVTIFGVTGTHEGGGGSIQTATVTLANSYAGNIYYTDENLTMQTVTSGSLTGVTAVVGTLVVVIGTKEPNPFPDPDIGVTLVASNSRSYPYYIYKVTG